MLLLLVTSLLATVLSQSPDLQTYRLLNSTAVWIARSDGFDQMQLAYSDAGDFVGRVVAFEYDLLVVTLVDFLGYAPFLISPVYDPYTTQ